MGSNGPAPDRRMPVPASPPPPRRVDAMDLRFTSIGDQLRQLYIGLGIEMLDSPITAPPLTVSPAPHPVVPPQHGTRRLLSALTDMVRQMARSRVASTPTPPVTPALSTKPVPDQHRVIQLRRPRTE